MECSDTEQKIGYASPSDVAVYLTPRSSTEYVASTVPSYTGGVEPSEGNYESLIRGTNKNEGKGNQWKTASKRVQWKDVPNNIKYTAYINSAMLVVLFIVDIVVVVILALPKEQDGGWSVWGSWGECSDTCGGGVRIRSRSCTNPSPSLTGRPCTGDSSDVSSCNRKPCLDHNVAFTAYNLYDSGTSNAILQFRSVHLNKGDAYSTATGKFTCKIPGVYYFAVTLAKVYKDIGALYVSLRINDSDKLRMYFDPNDDNSNELVSLPLTTSGTFHLNMNDTVDVYGIPSEFYSTYCCFTGILVFPDQKI